MNIFAPKTRFGAACCALSLLVSFVVGCTPKENPEPKPDPTLMSREEFVARIDRASKGPVYEL